MMGKTARERYKDNLRTLLQFEPLWRYGNAIPTPRQALFLALPHKEILYGGAAAGGKSYSLFLGSLLYVDQPDYNAILFRASFTDLVLPGALIDLSKQILWGTDAKWNGAEHYWQFPSGATINFGYLKNLDDEKRYQSTEFHYVGFDELTQLDEYKYTYLFTRLRRQEGCDIPLRMRAASNPGGVGHEWVFNRFINGSIARESYYEKQDRAFVPAFLKDNPHIDHESYRDSFNNVDATTRAQLLHGDWFVQPKGGVFERAWFDRFYTVNDIVDFDEQLISADLAFKEHATADYTVYQCWGRKGVDYYLIDQVRGQWGFPEAKRQFKLFCERNPGAYHKVIEDKAAGTSLIQELRRDVGGLTAYNPGTKSKVERAQLVAPFWEAGNCYLPSGRTWVTDFINECVSFPTARHDDQVDAMSQALIKFQKAKKVHLISRI